MMNWILIAMAAPPTDTSAQAAPAWVQFLPMIVIFAMFYFVLIRPQMTQQKKHQEMVKSLKSGDKVIAAGGIFGVITNVKDDVLTIKVADGVKIEVQRASVSSVTEKSND